MLYEHISLELVLFFILYGVTGVVPLLAALYLLLRRGNAFAPDVTTPVRLRRWSASFFGLSVLMHVWWLLFYIHSSSCHIDKDLYHSAVYVAMVVLDTMALLTTIAGTLLAMLQDRHRPVWPVFAAMVPYVTLGVVLIVNPGKLMFYIGIAYVLLLYLLFTVYMVFSVRQYRRWLHGNYADLERKEVSLTFSVVLFFMLLFFFYALVDIDNSILLYALHIFQLMFYVFLLWRVETLQQLDTKEQSVPLRAMDGESVGADGNSVRINLRQIEQLLAERCMDTQLYLQHDLTLMQLSRVIGVNRYYLSQYFSSQGTTYNAFINGLRIQHFISLYREAVADQRTFTIKQLAHDSGYRSYSTFSLAFKQRMGQNVTEWVRESG